MPAGPHLGFEISVKVALLVHVRKPLHDLVHCVPNHSLREVLFPAIQSPKMPNLEEELRDDRYEKEKGKGSACKKG